MNGETVIPLDVVHDVPYLLENGLASYCTEPSEVARLCGVIFVDGALQLTNRARQPLRRHPKSCAAKAATGVHASGLATPGGSTNGFRY